MNSLSTSSQKSMLTRIITGTVLVLIGVPCILFGQWFYFAAVAFLTIVGTHEFIVCSSMNRYNPLIFAIVHIYVLVATFLPFFFDADLNFSFGLRAPSLFISPFLLLVYFFLMFGAALVSDKITVHDSTFLLVMGVYWSLAMRALLYLRYIVQEVEPDYNIFASCTLFTYVLSGSTMNDIGAYFTGVLFGKHKMIPRISPNKTWEGFIGGYVFGFVFTFFFAMIMDKVGYPILPGYLDFASYHWVNVLILSLLLPLAGDFGDLIFSAMKRTYGIKDFGRIFPGHGGVLDRFDSLSFCVLMVAILVCIFIGGFKAIL